MDLQITLKDLIFNSFHGVLPHESQYGNEFIVNLSVTVFIDSDNFCDDIENTISYADLYEKVHEEMDKPRQLIEYVALKIYNAIKEKWGDLIKEGYIEIIKKNPPIPGFIGKAAIRLNF